MGISSASNVPVSSNDDYLVSESEIRNKIESCLDLLLEVKERLKFIALLQILVSERSRPVKSSVVCYSSCSLTLSNIMREPFKKLT